MAGSDAKKWVKATTAKAEDAGWVVEKTSVDMYMSDHFARHWERVTSCRKPMIALGYSPDQNEPHDPHSSRSGERP